MTVVVVTPPVPEIDLDLVKRHLRVDSDEDDALIETYIAAAVANIDGPGGWLGRCIWPQTLELRRSAFCDEIILPYGPVTSIESIIYIDGDGVEQDLDGAGYALLGSGAVVLANGASWPGLRGDDEGVLIQYEAGFETVPAAILSAVLLMVGDLYSNRESTGQITGSVEMSLTVQRLLFPHQAMTV